MFEGMTFEYLMSEMMSTMPDGIDTSEGSLIYNACAKQAVRLEEYYMQLSQVEYNAFVDTADLDHLIKIGNDRGITIKYATFSEFKAQFNIEIPLGTKFTGDDYNYTVLDVISAEEHTYTVICDTAGKDPNTRLVEIYPVDYIDGFESGKLLLCTKQGTDMEDTEVYRSRLRASFSIQGSGGNREYYLSKLKQYTGVGGAKIKRVQAPSDRIEITIIKDDYTAPDGMFTNFVQEYVDPLKNSGEGYGIAPIGHRCTVKAVEEATVNITATLTYEEGYDYDDVQIEVESKIEEYLKSLRQSWENTEQIYVRIVQIEAAIISVTGVADITGTKINELEAGQNLVLNGMIPVKGVITCF